MESLMLGVKLSCCGLTGTFIAIMLFFIVTKMLSKISISETE